MARLGAHLSAAGGLWRAVEAAPGAGCEAVQIFLRAPGRWRASDLSDADVARFVDAARTGNLAGRVWAHAPYLLNLASEDPDLRQRSVATLIDELQRAHRLGLAGLVLHPGSAGSGPRGPAEERCRESVAAALTVAGPGPAALLLEGTAGGGGHLGRSPGELARLVPDGWDVAPAPSVGNGADADGAAPAVPRDRAMVGVCLDTAHLWAAGFDLQRDGWERVIDELSASWGVVTPHLIHLNDTGVACGSRRDRHAPPGEGVLGEAFFRSLLSDPRTEATSMVLEIPPGESNQLVREALTRLRGWEPGTGDGEQQ
jgi:deoxyribonuclease-4